jgi:hypothetical protein
MEEYAGESPSAIINEVLYEYSRNKDTNDIRSERSRRMGDQQGPTRTNKDQLCRHLRCFDHTLTGRSWSGQSRAMDRCFRLAHIRNSAPIHHKLRPNATDTKIEQLAVAPWLICAGRH